MGRTHVRQIVFCPDVWMDKDPALKQTTVYHVHTFICPGTMAIMTQIAQYRRPGCKRSWIWLTTYWILPMYPVLNIWLMLAVASGVPVGVNQFLEFHCHSHLTFETGVHVLQRHRGAGTLPRSLAARLMELHSVQYRPSAPTSFAVLQV